MKQLEGKTALISGAGRGIGRATAVLMAEQGADLVLISRTITQLEKTAKMCRQHGGRVFVRPLDISESFRIDALFKDLRENKIKVNILVNNAAVMIKGAINNYSLKNMQTMLDINFFAAMYLSQKSIAIMKKSGGGTIVNVSSFSGCFGVEKFPTFGAYNISKYALWGLTEIMALENREFDIRVNQVSPSGVDTKMFRQAVPPGVEPLLTPEEVAKQIVYLASDNSYPLTGENIMLAGIPKK